MAADINGALSWENALELEDYLLSYLLYQEGKSIPIICRLRNLTEDVVKEHIIKAKIKHMKKQEEVNGSLFTQLLACDKNQRINYLEKCNEAELKGLIVYIKEILPRIDQPEDKMVAIWLAGHLKAQAVLPEIRQEYNNKHGGVRRMVCSALRKIPHKESIDILNKALQDNKPQVRQYAAKALGEIGDARSLNRLNNLINKPNEAEYVKRAYRLAIEAIEARIT